MELLYVRVPLAQQHQRAKALQTRSGQAGGLNSRSKWCKAACLSDSKGVFYLETCLILVKAPLTLWVLHSFHWRRSSGRVGRANKVLCFQYWSAGEKTEYFI